ncbi:MAG TPA: endonuclease/exonuclease/phosphatase family protein [Gemmatimonadales bacterium]
MKTTDIKLLFCDVGTGHVRLPAWRENVGCTVSLDATPLGLEPTETLVILDWNVWMGRGRLTEVVSRIRAGEYQDWGAAGDAPLVILLQEAYRVDESIPVRFTGRGGRRLVTRMQPQEDVVDTALRLGLSLRYAPSMRNGTERSDRGNAILSSLPLQNAVGIELPLMLQRRVALCAELVIGERRLLVMSAHLDPRGPPGHKWLGAAGRAAQTEYLLQWLEAQTVVLGADLNLGRGRAERSWRLLSHAGFNPGLPPRLPTWRHTYHGITRLLLDYLLIRDGSRIVADFRVHRLDEDFRDRARAIFGSDHHPLLGVVTLNPGLPGR